MSDKKEVGLNEVDMQAVLVSWIIAHDCCGDINCKGDRGIFKGVECPVDCLPQYTNSKKRVAKAKKWLKEYYSKKAEAAETEKQKVEAAKKEGQETKKTCGECRHIYDADGSVEIGLPTTLCHKKSIRVPIEFTGCHDFDPMATGKMTLQSQNSASERSGDDMIYNGILIGTPSQEDKLRHKAWLLEIENSHRLNDIERLKTEAAKRTAEDAERISRLENEKAELLEGRERLTEQRNRLSIDLVKATRRAKEVEREKDILAKKLVDFTAKFNDLSGVCTEKDGLIDRLRKENAELRRWYEQLKKDSFHRLFEALCKAKVLEKEIDRLLIDQSIMERRLQLYTSAFR